MRQFILPEDFDGSPTCRIEGGRARYLLRVLRLAPGDRFAGLDAAGRRRAVEVLATEGEGITLAVGQPEEGPSPAEPLPDAHGSRGKRAARGTRQGPDRAHDGTGTEAAPAPSPLRPGTWPRVILVQSIAKGPAMDLVLRQAAEAGVSRLIPLAARRSVVRPEAGEKGESGSAKRTRWERIVREGLQQSGSPVPTRLEEATTLAKLEEALGPPRGRRLGILLHEAPLAEGSLHGYLTEAPDEIVLCVGPEGGFAPDEAEFLLAAGYKPLRLPGAVLRTETAALYAVAAVETILTERSSWSPSS
ncbi:MAG: 16S rRNA (uracil(1498)-N(3))-methyltransferase [Spirochaetaceae bacterium]|nr:16S rRNA (uracil(1498)-N(3))-methyltransferase [Spirochaetaceae bacterium]